MSSPPSYPRPVGAAARVAAMAMGNEVDGNLQPPAQDLSAIYRQHADNVARWAPLISLRFSRAF